MTTEPTTVPLNQPLYGASFGAAFSRFWRKYATFSGRASRSEYWWFVLVGIIVAAIFFLIGQLAGGVYQPSDQPNVLVPGAGYGIYITLAIIWGLATLIPSLALVWRRLHDSNHSGGFYFLGLIPFVGPIIVLVLLLFGPDQAGVRFDK